MIKYFHLCFSFSSLPIPSREQWLKRSKSFVTAYSCAGSGGIEMSDQLSAVSYQQSEISNLNSEITKG